METQQTAFNTSPEPQPEVFPIDTNKIESIEDIKVLLSVLGIAMTEQFAEQYNLTHLLKK